MDPPDKSTQHTRKYKYAPVKPKVNAARPVQPQTGNVKEPSDEHADADRAAYQNSYIRLPLRQPSHENPEHLDEEEFGEAAASLNLNETINTALDLGLLEENKNFQMLFLQLPTNLPIDKQLWACSQRENGKEEAVPSENESKGNENETLEASGHGIELEALQGGYMGKMLVYKSGAVKLKLGEHVFDVSEGSQCIFAEDVAAINTEDNTCCVLGQIDKRVVVTPDIDSILKGNTLDDLV